MAMGELGGAGEELLGLGVLGRVHGVRQVRVEAKDKSLL